MSRLLAGAGRGVAAIMHSLTRQLESLREEQPDLESVIVVGLIRAPQACLQDRSRFGPFTTAVELLVSLDAAGLARVSELARELGAS